MFERKPKQKQKMDGLISNATDIVGNVIFKGGQHIDGNVKGNITSDDPDSLLVIGETAVVEGDLRAATVIINGRVTGNVVGKLVEIEQSAKLVGDIHYTNFISHLGCFIKGSLNPMETPDSASTFAEENQ